MISGNAGPGVIVDGSRFPSSGTIIQSNYIGVDRFGSSGLANTDGVQVIQSGPYIKANVISGNSDDGIDIIGGGPPTVITGNIIGLDFTGTIDIGGNASDGIQVTDSGSNQVGVIGAGGNIISGNGENGILISGTASIGNWIVNNRIGTDTTGTLDRGNTLNGIAIAGNSSGVIIGSNGDGNSDPGEANLISGNNGHGVAVASAASVSIAGNRIGTSLNGITQIPNVGDGVSIQSSSDVTIGGLGSSQGNQIANNFGGGVVSLGNSSSGVSIRANEIVNNVGLGIDFAIAGVSVNDPGESDGLQNFPALSAALSGSTTEVTGSLTSSPNSTFQIDFYASDIRDSSSFGEGQRYLGSTSILLDGSGYGDINVSGLASTLTGEFVTATATDAAGNTSEFSLAQQTTSTAPPTILQDSLLVTVIDQGTEQANFGLPTLIVNEGDLLFLTGDFADADSSVAVSINWGDGQTTTDPVIRRRVVHRTACLCG